MTDANGTSNRSQAGGNRLNPAGANSTTQGSYGKGTGSHGTTQDYSRQNYSPGGPLGVSNGSSPSDRPGGSLSSPSRYAPETNGASSGLVNRRSRQPVTDADSLNGGLKGRAYGSSSPKRPPSGSSQVASKRETPSSAVVSRRDRRRDRRRENLKYSTVNRGDRTERQASPNAKGLGNSPLASKVLPPKVSAGKGSGRNSRAIVLRSGAEKPAGTGPRRRSRRALRTPKSLLYFGRLVIAGLGIAAIGGTVLTMMPNGDSRSAARTESALATNPQESVPRFPVALSQQIAPLKAEIEGLPNTYPGLSSKVFYLDVDTKNYVDVEGSEAIAAASTIKLPILLAFFEEVDAGRIDLNQTMAIEPQQIAEGSGDMQLSPPGTRFTALEVATQMIVNSDNTATNMMIDLLGGSAALNERFKGYGLEKTQIISPLPDLEGTNLTSARDLAHVLLLIQGDQLTTRSRDRVFNILQRTRNKGLLAAGLEEKEALTYNKTGDIGSVLGDAALVDLTNGKRYILVALVQRPNNDGRAVDLLHQISQSAFKQADQAVQPAVSPLGSSDGATPRPLQGQPDAGTPAEESLSQTRPQPQSGVTPKPVEGSPQTRSSDAPADAAGDNASN